MIQYAGVNWEEIRNRSANILADVAYRPTRCGDGIWGRVGKGWKCIA